MKTSLRIPSTLLCEEIDLEATTVYQKLPYHSLKKDMVLEFVPGILNKKMDTQDCFVVIIELGENNPNAAKTIMDETGKVKTAISDGFVFYKLIWKTLP